MKKCVTVLDYGVGNLFSVSQAFTFCGAEVKLADDAAEIIRADYLVLPGVGAFGDAMTELNRRGFTEPIKRFAASGKPFLGICLGMQMMMESSDEFGRHAGLGLIQGHVQAIPPEDASGLRHKIPHIGWNPLWPGRESPEWKNTVLETVTPGDAVYFVHSFTANCTDSRHSLAETEYAGRRLTAVVKSGPLYGCQFHPEKSGPVGLKIILQFLQL
ncbi:MAG: imidazole glycerol phosphate synthase, glutamine amidotransferase subunit [Omnitrophica bacterium GWA2_52_8]|nr:MAG: imidazole glycerol phosphate synthase, glutamine amidotransferase subunit [Omnitrophica bacterium GWA2_52_8]